MFKTQVHDSVNFQTIVNNNEQETLDFMKDRFEKLAINILDGLHETCEIALRDKALNSGWERLDNMSYIDMAYACKAKDFAAHPACQELQDKRWKRGVTSEVLNNCKAKICAEMDNDSALAQL